jgi:hypothetical protein
MTTPTKFAFCTDDPIAVEAYRICRAARREFSVTLLAGAAAIGHNTGPLSHRNDDGSDEIVGLRPDNSGKAPGGWRLVERGKRLAPADGRKGDPARRWIAQHQPPKVASPMYALKDHGLALLSRAGTVHDYTDSVPHVFLHEDKLWACYTGTPKTPVTWPAAELSDYRAAYAAFEHAQSHTEAVRR